MTAHGGIALLATGHLQHAERAGRFLLRMHRMQPDPANRYLTVWDTRRDEPIADYDGRADMPWGDGSALRRHNPEGGNAYWDIGYIIAFLTALCRATGEHDYLNAAREMFDLFDRYAGFADHVWKTPWACAALHQATGDPRYLAAAVRMADQVVAAQQADGGFFLGPQSATWMNGPGSGPMRSADTRRCRPIRIYLSTPPRRWLTTWRRCGPSCDRRHLAAGI